jgi:molybdate transport system permease protein
MRRRPDGGQGVGVRPPLLVVTLAIAGTLVFFVAPFAGLLQRAPWSQVWSHLTDPVVRTALRISIECSVAATALALIFGLPIAWVLARTEFRGKAIVRAFAILPMVLPPVVSGVALSEAFGRRGLVGQYFDRWFGITLPFTTTSVILAETFVAMPFLVITVEAALRSLDTRYEAAGATLGAGRWTVIRRITLPAIAPSLAAGAALTWARALGEFGATITFAGNLKGVTQTMPLAVYIAFESDPGSAIVLSLVLLAVSITVLAVVGRRVFGARPVVPAVT